MDNIKNLKRKIDRYRYGNLWVAVKEEVTKNPSIGITAAVSFLLFGSVIAASINYVSLSEEALGRFIISFVLCLLLLLIGFFFFLPYWSFKRKYSFIDDLDINLAKKLVAIYNRSKQALTSIDGINAIQLFTIETHTNDLHVLYRFKRLFSMKSKYFDLSKFKGSEIEVPIDLFSWLKNPTIPTPNYGDDINPLIYKLLETKSLSNQHYNMLFETWEVDFYEVPKIYSVHYHVIIEAKKPVDDILIDRARVIASLQTMKYNGAKDDHNNRLYYTLRVTINDLEEGALDCIMLIIANNKRININTMVNLLCKIFNP